MVKQGKEKRPPLAKSGSPAKTAAPRTEDGDTEQKILDAAHRVFLRGGTAGARMQEIADEAGVNKALLHYYFRTKERLAEAIFLRAAGRLFPPAFRILASDAAIPDKVTELIHHYLKTLSQSPYLPGYVLSELNYHPDRILRLMESVTGMPADGFASRIFSKLTEQIEASVAAGEMRPIAAPQFAVNLLSLCIFPFAAQSLLKVGFGWGEKGFQQFIVDRQEQLPGFFLDALRP